MQKREPPKNLKGFLADNVVAEDKYLSMQAAKEKDYRYGVRWGLIVISTGQAVTGALST